jgi:hypothetical protein
MKSKIVLGIAAVALLAVMVGNAYACIGDARTPGFWKHNVGVYLGERNGSYSDPTVYPGQTPLVTKDTMGTWLAAHWTQAELEDLYEDLCTIGGGAAGAAIRNTAANVFNAEADLYLLPV